VGRQEGLDSRLGCDAVVGSDQVGVAVYTSQLNAWQFCGLHILHSPAYGATIHDLQLVGPVRSVCSGMHN
jgi:hypothetical protein